MAQALFITQEDLVKHTALNGNVDPDKFTQFIKIAQDIHVQTIWELIYSTRLTTIL